MNVSRSVMDTDAITPHQRLYFLDYVRVALTMLVVVHHLAITYSVVAPWYYIEIPNSENAALILGILVLINQAFFMGLFFLIAGYFTPASFDRKGARHFLRDRVIRLGVPLLLFIFVLAPLAMLPAFEYTNSIAQPGESVPYWQFYLISIGPGPMWFLELLLLFAVGYALWRKLSPTPLHTAPSTIGESSAGLPAGLPSVLQIAIFALLLGVITFLWRRWVPIGTNVPIVALPSLSHLPQYISFFIIGILCYRRNWLLRIPDNAGRLAFGIAALSTVAMLGYAAMTMESFITLFVGGFYMPALIYAMWEGIFAVCMAIGLLTAFRHHFNRDSRLGGFLASNAFAVYVFHAPVIVALAYALQGWQADSLLKFVVASLLGIPLCFAVAALVRKLPYAAHVF